MMKGGGFHTVSALEYEAWRALSRSCGQSIDESVEVKGFVGSWRGASIWGLEAADVSSNIHRRIERTHRHVRLDDMDNYKAFLQVGGRSTLIQNERVMELAAGDVAFVDLTRPVTFVSAGVRRLINLNLPRQSLISRLGLEPEAGLFRSGDTLAGGALFRLILDAVDACDPSSVLAEPYMQLAIYDLVGALFAASDLSPISSPADKLFRRICSIIKDHLSDPDIGPAEVAAEAGISLRYLQKLFAVRGTTCSLFMQSLRLEHAARLLHGRALTKTGQPISEIAYACGFRDYSHFSKTFRHRFGHSPGAKPGHDQSVVK